MGSGRHSESTSEDGKSASHNSSVDQDKIVERRDVDFSDLPQSVDNMSMEPALKRQKLSFEESSPPREEPANSDEARCLEHCEKKSSGQNVEDIPLSERVADQNIKESDADEKRDDPIALRNSIPSTTAVISSAATTSTSLESLEKTSNAIAMLLKLQNFPSGNSSASHIWGRLLSLFPQHPHVPLSGYCFTIGRSRGCNLQLKDPGISGLLCRLCYSPFNVVTMENLGSNGILQINGKIMKKNSPVVLRGGDEIGFNSGRNYSFIFQPAEESYNPSASPLLNLTGGATAETFAALGAASAHAAAAAVAAANQVAANKLSANMLSIAELAAANESNNPSSKDVGAFKFPQSDPAAVSASVSEPKIGIKSLNEKLNSISLPEDLYCNNFFHLLKSSFHTSGVEGVTSASPGSDNLKGKKIDLDLDLLTLEGDHGKKNSDENVENSLQRVEKLASDDLKKLISASLEANVMKILTKENETGKKDSATNNSPENKEKDDISQAITSKKQSIKEDFAKQILNPKDISVNFDNFPYYISDITRDHLFSAVFVHLKRHDFSKFAFSFSSLSPRILLTGPIGTEIYQETLVKALAHHFSSRLIIFDVLLMSPDVKEDDIKVDKPAIDFPSHELVSLDEIDETIFPSSSGILKSMALRRRTFDEPETASNPPPPTSPTAVTPNPLSSKKNFKKGDRVRFLGPMNNAGGIGSSMHGYFCSLHGMDNAKKIEPSNIRGPYVGCKGKVVLVFEENPRKIGVCFDKPIPGGNNLGNLCPDGRGFFCNVNDLRLESSLNEDDDKIIAESLFEVLSETAKNSPIILFIKDVEKNLFSSLEKCSTFKRKLDKLEPKIVVIASQTVSENKKEKTNTYNLFYPKSSNGGHAAGLFDLSFLDNFPRSEERSKDNSKMNKLLARLFPCKVSVLAPQGKEESLEWKNMLERDIGIMRANSNRNLLKSVLLSHNLECDNLQEINISDSVLTSETAEKIIGWSLSHHLMSTENQEFVSEKLKIPYLSIHHGLRMLDASQKESNQTFKKALKDIMTDNEFEKRLLSEVIPPHEIGVSFNDIGALESVKETLKELVMLPLQRPELFCRGQLTKPCKGILLFGPPGTGKTMLAKAVATEAGANFINISMSTIASKWFGEGEKFVKAVFSLASKIAPSVVFIDEVDSMLGKREKPGEHEAMRKIKNEFMAHWDGLRTREQERVLVLAATNRPFDLDEAVVRRLPRRLFVNLPDCENRVKVLRVILSQEELVHDFDFNELASLTEGYSGSDLKNLCVMASFRPIRELLEKEKKDSQGPGIAKDASCEHTSPPNLRKLCMDDFKNALGQVCASVSTDATSMQELLQWNDLFGEGKLKKKTPLTYFM